MKGRIHCSQETADQLIMAGKTSWLKTREDRITAKGKGEMQTYVHLTYCNAFPMFLLCCEVAGFRSLTSPIESYARLCFDIFIRYWIDASFKARSSRSRGSTSSLMDLSDHRF